MVLPLRKVDRGQHTVDRGKDTSLISYLLYALYCILSTVSCLLFSESLALSQEIITLETTPYPIYLTADYISTWQKVGVRVFLANNNVWITQG
ncbi:MAG: hypothetical protein HZA70_06730, partial [Planctomycetes bacterium]|nr:hypothetical protein [Planctomycetota bacterium]